MFCTQTGRVSSVVALLAASALVNAIPASAHPHVWVTTQTTVLYENGTIVGLRQKWSFDDFYTSMALQGLDTNNDGVYDRSELAELAKVNLDGLKEFSYFTAVKLGGESLKFEAPKDFWLEHAEGPAGESQVTSLTDAEMDKEIAAADERDRKAAGAPTSEPGFFSRLWAWLFGPSKEAEKAPATPPAPTKVLSLHFTLPLAQPVLADAPGFTFAISDPSFFIAFEPAAKDAVVLGPGAPAGCRVATGEAEAPSEAAPPAAAGDPTPAAPEPNPAADPKSLGDAFAQQFGAGSVTTRFGRPTSISCGSRS